LVNMANYYNKLVRNLKEQFWIKDSCSALNEELAGKFDLKEITDKAVTFWQGFWMQETVCFIFIMMRIKSCI